MTPEQEQEIIRLRAANLTPKQIAKQLKLKPADVIAAIKLRAEQTAIVTSDGLPPIAECLINKTAKLALLGGQEDDEDGTSGLATILVARGLPHRNWTVASYLVDYWCLGVKDVIPPKSMTKDKYALFVSRYFERSPEGSDRISLEQAQSIIYGSIEYARKLGFQPARDFEQAREHLGNPSQLQELKFGRNGKPYYISGPYDDTNRIMKTLQNSIGDDNFNFVTEVPQSVLEASKRKWVIENRE